MVCACPCNEPQKNERLITKPETNPLDICEKLLHSLKNQKLIVKLLEIAAPRIVYVSCNTATQARDLGLLSEKYAIEKIQPVDMFPHTHHIECVVLLKLR